jgi:hypothetical protein
MTDVAKFDLSGWTVRKRCETIARFWGLHWSAIQLTVLKEKGGADLARLKYLILRRHQRSHFLEGVEKLGIDRTLPPAVVAGRYHYLSNMIGGLTMEYVEETPKKVWIRYLPPAWSFPGQSLFAVPPAVEHAMFAGWHPFNGASLGTKRLAFVVTKVYQQGEPYDEGYFIEHDYDLDEDQHIRFEPATQSPDFDPERAPRLSPTEWPEERLAKARRNFALGYVEDALVTTLEMYGVHGASQIVGHAARLTAIQFFGEFKSTFGVNGTKAQDLVSIIASLADLAGDEMRISRSSSGGFAIWRTNRILAGRPPSSEIYAALFEFVRMGAKVLNPRVRVVLEGIDLASKVEERWIVQNTEQRLF